MTKKHFKAIAQTIKETDFKTSNDKELLVHALSNTFRQLNPRFDFNKFYNACFE